MKLFIDSSDNLQTIVRLDEHETVFSYTSPREQDVLGAIVMALQEQRASISDLTAIEVMTGPGSFTGLRVGVSIANALSFALNVPINGEPAGTVVEPVYGKPASITPKKKK